MKPFASLTLMTALVLASGSALALQEFSQSTSKSKGNQFGNDNFNADYLYETIQHNDHDGTSSSYSQSSGASAKISANAAVFGKRVSIFQAGAGGQGIHSYRSGTHTHMDDVFGYLFVAGDALYWVSGFDEDDACYESSPSFNSCSSYSKSVTQNLFSAEGSFTLGFVPVTVKAKVKGSVYANLEGWGTGAMASTDASFFGKGGGKLTAGANVTAHLTATAGIDDVLACGVTASIKLIDVAVSPTVSSTFLWRDLSAGDKATVHWNNQAPLTIKSLDGKVTATVDTLLGDYSRTLIDWDGYSSTSTLWDKSGSANYD